MKKCKVLIKGIFNEVEEDVWEIEDKDYEKFFDINDGVIYAMYHFEKGKKKYSFLSKRFWEHLEEIGKIVNNPNLTPEEQKIEINKIIAQDNKK